MSKSTPDPALIRQARSNIIELLELYASEVRQREYQKNVAWVPVPTELVEMWFDDAYHPQEPSFQLAFNSAEIEALARFHEHFGRITHGRERISFGGDLERLLENERWRQLMAEASIVLEVVNNWDKPPPT